MDSEREIEIAEGLRAGRTEDWFRLYDAYADRVWRLAARLMAPYPSDVADVVQEIFLAAAQSARTYDRSRGVLWSWLSGITRRQVALYFRKHARQSIALGSEVLEPVDEQGPAGIAQVAELAEQVRATLTRLPVDYEILLTAKYIDGASVAEIARSENTTDEAARSKLARARRAFRKLYDAS